MKHLPKKTNKKTKKKYHKHHTIHPFYTISLKILTKQVYNGYRNYPPTLS